MLVVHPRYEVKTTSIAGKYSHHNQDYSWQHDVPIPSGAQITSANLTIPTFDVEFIFMVKMAGTTVFR